MLPRIWIWYWLLEPLMLICAENLAIVTFLTNSTSKPPLCRISNSMTWKCLCTGNPSGTNFMELVLKCSPGCNWILLADLKDGKRAVQLLPHNLLAKVESPPWSPEMHHNFFLLIIYWWWLAQWEAGPDWVCSTSSVIGSSFCWYQGDKRIWNWNRDAHKKFISVNDADSGGEWLRPCYREEEQVHSVWGPLHLQNWTGIEHLSCLLYYFLCQSCYCIARTVSTYMCNCVSLQITGNIGMVYSGMGPDYRLLIRRARKMAQVVHAP